MFNIIRAPLELMDEVRTCINSNYDLYEKIVDPVDLAEHQVDKIWAERNYKIREFYLAREDHKYVGTASYQKLGSFAYIGYFYIKNGFQRQGFGRVLMNFMEMRTLMDNVTDLRLFANAKSQWALNFYERLGFNIAWRKKEDILALDNGIMKPFYEENSNFLQKILIPKKLKME
jgi:ribosomal protein S18 acetylase RimI-like enzyme